MRSPSRLEFALAFLLLLALPSALSAKGPKVHSVSAGKPQPVFWTSASDPAVRLTMKVRPLVVDGKRKAWVSGDVHDITDHSFAALEVQHLNDALPGDKASHFIWKATGWLLAERATGHVSELKFAGYDPGVSGLEWFRDYAAFCAISAAKGGRLDAEIVELGTRKPLTRKKIADWPLPAGPSSTPSATEAASPQAQGQPQAPASPVKSPAKHLPPATDASPRPQVCAAIRWQREPLQASFALHAGDTPLVLTPGPAPATETADPEQ